MSKWVRGVFIANLVAQLGIVFTGALVRVTASGLGCPTWPECVEGSLTPTSTQTEQWHKYIEFGNRTLTFVLGLLAIASLVAGFVAWKRMQRKDVFILSAVPLAGTLAQAILGGITVLTGLHPLVVAAHFLLSLAIIAGVVVLVHRASGRNATPAPNVIAAFSWLLVVLAGLVAGLGTIVTGSGPHSGDADAGRLDLDPRLISWLHADVVLLFLGLAVGLLIALSVAHIAGQSRAWLVALLAIGITQGVIGYTQYFTGLPWLLVSVHALGAALLWMSAWFVALSLKRGQHRSSEAISGPGNAR